MSLLFNFTSHQTLSATFTVPDQSPIFSATSFLVDQHFAHVGARNALGEKYYRESEDESGSAISAVVELGRWIVPVDFPTPTHLRKGSDKSCEESSKPMCRTRTSCAVRA